MIVSNRKIMLVSLLSLAAMILVLFLTSLESQAAETPIDGVPSGDVATGDPRPLSASTTCTVTITDDSGSDSLRQCLLDAEAGDIITFDPNVFPATITLTSDRLPDIDQGNITIDGSGIGVIIDGSQLPSVYDDGFRIISNSNTIKGLTIQNFPSDGVEIGDGAQNRIENCVIRGNGKRGVHISGTSSVGNTVTRNGITGNTEMGILLSNGGNAWITRPLIHTVVTSTGWITVTGWATPTAVVEVFADPGGEGATFLGQTTPDVMGAFTFSVTNTAPYGNNITVTATDADGNTSEFGCYPLPRPTLVWPLSGTSIPGGEFSSPYGPRHKASEDRYDWHRGIDIAVPTGTLAYAVADGKVRCAGDCPGYSDPVIVQLEHEDGCYYCNYLHMLTNTVETGDMVTQGITVGLTGGTSSLDHLHFEIRRGGYYQRHAVNPFLYLPYTDTVRHTVVFSNVETAIGDSVLVTATVVVTAPRDELDFNAITLEVRGADGSLLDWRSIDFHALNARTQYPVPTPDPLDNPCIDSSVCISPTHFSTGSDEYHIEFTFGGMQGHCPMTLIASAADVHQNVVHATYPVWCVYLPIIVKNYGRVNITGIICRPKDDPVDMQGEKVFLPTRHFDLFGYDHSGFLATVINPQTNYQIEAQIIAFRDSNSMPTWDKCDFALKKTMRQALGGDLDEVVYIEPLENRPPRTLVFIYTGQTQD